MKLLLHICCAPCAVFPVDKLRSAGVDVMGFFYRHNIHPYTECMRRQETLEIFAESAGLRVIFQKDYDMEGFLRSVVFRESERCAYCYYDRLKSTALMARSGKFEAFSSTLLYSKFQKHDQIRSIGEAVGKSFGIEFYYDDFRLGWKAGVEASKKMNLYRQQYCGCIFSEKERFYKGSKVHRSKVHR